MPEKASSEDIEAAFRENLRDLVPLAQRLAPHCSSTADLINVLGLALEHDGQLRLLMSLVTASGKSPR